MSEKAELCKIYGIPDYESKFYIYIKSKGMFIYDYNGEHYFGTVIGDDVEFGQNVVVLKGVVIEAGSKIGDAVVFDNFSSVGKNSRIGNGIYLGEVSAIGDNVEIGDNTYIEMSTDIGNEVQIGNECHIWRGVEIHDNTVLEENVTVRSDVTIGKCCLIKKGIHIPQHSFIADEQVIAREPLLFFVKDINIGEAGKNLLAMGNHFFAFEDNVEERFADYSFWEHRFNEKDKELVKRLIEMIKDFQKQSPLDEV